jgi:CubicO group peptidase (beta-lactamase class C family)
MKQYLFFFILMTSQLAQASVELEDFLFIKPDKGFVTDALVISKAGEVVYEKYAYGNAQTRHLLWSMSKSISSILFGIAEQKGYIHRNDPISKYFEPEFKAMPKEQAKKYNELKLSHFLGMSSGLAWNEYYEASPFNSDVVRMLYFETKKSVVDYILKTPIREKPGKRFYYSSGDTNVFMAALQRALPDELKQTYPWTFLFEPMQMQATFETDASGVFMGSSYAYLNTKDLLKLGELIMNKGVYQGRRIVSEDYMTYALTLSEPMALHGRCLVDSNMTYGAQFWLNHACADGKRPFMDAPSDMIMLLGHGGQKVFIFPTQKIVAVRIARDDNDKLDKNRFAKLILEAYAKDI